jgi:hypothetical protein
VNGSGGVGRMRVVEYGVRGIGWGGMGWGGIGWDGCKERMVRHYFQ